METCSSSAFHSIPYFYFILFDKKEREKTTTISWTQISKQVINRKSIYERTIYIHNRRTTIDLYLIVRRNIYTVTIIEIIIIE